VGRSTDGFLGSNVFRNYVVEIDYAKPSAPSPRSDNLLVLRLGSAFATPVYLGQHTECSGAGSGARWDRSLRCLLNRFRRDVRALADEGLQQRTPRVSFAKDTIEVPNVVAVGGELSARVGWVPAIRLGGFVVSMPFTQFPKIVRAFWPHLT